MNKYISKSNIIYVIEFLIFCILISKAPVINDRWMEMKTGVLLEHPLRIFFTQVRWFQAANGRIFSNLFSYVVDGYSTYVRTIVNSLMVTAISWMINHIVDSKTIVAIIIPFSISFAGWKEVYFYATTFYVSAAFLLVLWIYFEKKETINRVQTKYIYLFCIFAFISSMWVENLSITMCGLWGSIALYKLYKKEKYIRHLLICLFGTIGAALMFLSARFSTNGRLNNNIEQLFLNKMKLFVEVLGLEYILFIVLSVVIIRLLFYNKSKKIYKIINLCIWIMILIINSVYLARRAYMIIGSDPVDGRYNSVCGWQKFESLSLNKLFSHVDIVMPFLNITVFIVGLISLFIVTHYFCSKYKHEIYFLVFIDVVCVFITSITMYDGGGRVLFIFEILTGIIICLFYVQVEKDYKLREQVTVLLFIFSVFWCQYAFIEPYSIIASEREQIAQFVKHKQELNEWDYNNDMMYFPSYKRNNVGDGLFGDRCNPKLNDVYYVLMLQYYKLDENTLIIYD